jgi:hypothetical protein
MAKFAGIALRQTHAKEAKALRRRAGGYAHAKQFWVRGTVVSVRGEWMTVRIDDPGRFANQVDGVSVAAGVTLLSEPRVWVPCL